VSGSALLLDTHAFLWWKTFDPRLSSVAREAIENGDNGAYLSAVSCLEIAVKFELGKLDIAPELARNVELGAIESGLGTLPISFAHCQRSGQFRFHHKDPFDRLLVAQALIEGMVLVSKDERLDAYGVTRIW
jgi:PIN domain nuclease of toxin-antitoxin system